MRISCGSGGFRADVFKYNLGADADKYNKVREAYINGSSREEAIMNMNKEGLQDLVYDCSLQVKDYLEKRAE